MVTPLPTSARSSTRCVSHRWAFDPACTAREVLEHATGRRARYSRTAGTANPAADMHEEWQSGERRYLSEGSMAT